MARIVCSYKYDTKLSLYIADMSDQYNGVRVAKYTLTDEYGNEHIKTSAVFGGDVTAGGDITIDNLTPGTYYSISATVYNYANSEWLATVSGYGATTFPTTPTITCTPNTDSVSLTITPGDGNVKGYYWEILQGETVIESENVLGGGTFTRTISNLEENTVYSISAYAFIYLSDGTKYYDETSYSDVVYFNTNGEIEDGGDTNFTVTMFRPVQKNIGELCAEVGLEGDNLIGCTYVIYHYATDGSLVENTRGVFTQNGGLVDIYFDEFRKYNLLLKVTRGGATVSKTATVNISDNCLKSVSYKRVNRGLIFSWDIYPDEYENYSYIFNGRRYPDGKLNELYDGFADVKEYTLSNLKCATTYELRMLVDGLILSSDGYIRYDIGEWGTEYIATAPSCPYSVTAYMNGNSVNVNWQLAEVNGDDISLRVNLYKDGNIVNSYDFDVAKGTTSGTSVIETNGLTNGEYEVKISTHYGNIWCVDEYGNGYSIATSLTIDSARPDNFYWTYPKMQGQDINITAVEWQSLTNKINEFRRYCGLADFAFGTTAITGEDFTDDIYNEAREALQDILQYSVMVGTIESVASGQKVTAYSLNISEEAINSIN